MRLTRDEMVLVACLIGALVVGAVVKHYRDHTRAAAATVDAGSKATSRR